ncbi:MAG: SufD family Fe-S cluster assembly protein, partial [Candidatus Veblenbacteria bacterium]|nr:SufD family Fe-S cluster assembly protein [Candidatus Veblenbacteria bacterium]
MVSEPCSYLTFEVAEGAAAHVILTCLAPECQVGVLVRAGAQVVVTVAAEAKTDVKLMTTIRLVGSQARAHQQVALIGHAGVQHLDCNLVHEVPVTFGRLTARRVQLGDSRGALTGMLAILPEAQKTDTYLSDKALLLGAQSQATSDPRLEIQADDVRASHGATIGQLSAEELFYLRSRGLAEETA